MSDRKLWYSGKRPSIGPIPLALAGQFGKRVCAECREFKHADYWSDVGWRGKATQFFCGKCGEALFTMQETLAMLEGQP